MHPVVVLGGGQFLLKEVPLGSSFIPCVHDTRNTMRLRNLGWARFCRGARWEPPTCALAPNRGISIIRNSAPLAPYSRTMPRALWWSSGGGLFHMSDVPL